MANVQQQFKNKLMSALGEALWIVGQKALVEAKSTVPVKTGNLKASGTISRVIGSNQYKWSCNINFSAPYAQVVEEGRAAEPYDNTPYTYNVRAHKRKTPGGGQINVKAHTATLIGQRRVPFGGGFVTLSRKPEIKGRYFLRNAIAKTMDAQLNATIKGTMPKKMTLSS